MTQPGIEPRSPGPLVNTLTAKPMKLDKFYQSIQTCFYLYCYIHNVLAHAFFGFLQMFLVELRSLNRTSNQTLYSIHRG